MATSETRPEWKSVTIPGDFLARHINRAVSNSVGFFQLVESKPIREWRKPDYIYKISSAEIRAEKIRYAARIKLDFADQTIDYKTGETINAKSAILKDFTDVRQTGLIQCLKTIARIARNHSDGQRVTCYISLDHSYRADSPNSYYWYITDETRQSRAKYPQFYMNGGIIAHKNRADETRPGDFWEYRIHT